MTRVASLLALLSLTLSCSRTLYLVSTAQSTATPDAAYECVQARFKQLGYERVRHDPTERWYVARRFDPTVRISSTTFRRAFDLIDVRIRPDASGNTSLEIKAQSFHQYELQRGQTDEEQEASARVKGDAAALAEGCAK